MEITDETDMKNDRFRIKETQNRVFGKKTHKGCNFTR